MLLVSTLALLLRLFPQSQFRSGNELPPSKTPIVGSCAHDYSIEILSVDPIIIYINNFISESEIDHLLKE
jgi:prolyl 4-hydroxylase